MVQNGETNKMIFAWEKHAVVEEYDEHDRGNEVRQFYQ